MCVPVVNKTMTLNNNSLLGRLESLMYFNFHSARISPKKSFQLDKTRNISSFANKHHLERRRIECRCNSIEKMSYLEDLLVYSIYLSISILFIGQLSLYR